MTTNKLAQVIAARLIAAHRSGAVRLGGRDEVACAGAQMSRQISPTVRRRLFKLWREHGRAVLAARQKNEQDEVLAAVLSA